jgi:hypothetical protein
MTHEPRHAVIQYPGGIRVRFRWSGSGQAEAVFALAETGGTLVDHGPLVSTEPDQLCRAELRVETPAGPWAVRLASAIFDDPAGVLWDTENLFLVAYGFMVYAFEARTGVLRWHHRSGTPLVAVLGSSRLRHILVQTEIETFAIEPNGEVAWRAAHSDVVISAELIGGRLVLGSFAGQTSALDPATGQELG